jgi:hypothetical protein
VDISTELDVLNTLYKIKPRDIETGVDSTINVDETCSVHSLPTIISYPLFKALAEQAVLSPNRRYGILKTSIRPAGAFREADTETMEKVIPAAKNSRMEERRFR